MRLLKTEITELVRTLNGGDLFTTKIKYKASEANGELVYSGPKIPPQVWREILSFFKWSYDTTKGESQVRLFVSTEHQTWKAWAFPQQASMGMSTRELNTEDSKKQRAELFTDQDKWVAWGTVHHHCDMGAFQSSTDENDEKNVGGLHITIGDMEKPHHSMHARLYHQGDLYEPDMSKFWEIGNITEGLPIEVRALLPSNAEDKIAREQMCIPSSVEFPPQWKKNLIEVRTQVAGYGQSWAEKDGDYKWIGQLRYQRRNGIWVEAPWEYDSVKSTNHKKENHGDRRRGYCKDPLLPIGDRMKEAMDSLEQLLLIMGVLDIEEVLTEIENFIEEPTYVAIARTCKEFHLLPTDLLDEAFERVKSSVAQSERLESGNASGSAPEQGTSETAAGFSDV